MKTLILITTFICLFCNRGQAQVGVNFEDLTYSEALSKAAAENKLLFVDCYTSWCGPCKYMSEKVFTQKEAGDFFNPIFISVKYDMEKGEGKELASRFNVRAYPTFLIICPDGSVQHKIVGGGDLDKFIAKVRQGINPQTSLAYLERLYKEETITNEQLILYQTALIGAMEIEKSKIVTQELNERLSIRDKISEIYWPIIEKSEYGSADYQLLISNVSSFYKIVDHTEIDHYIAQTILRKLQSSENSIATLKRMRKDIAPLHLADQTLLELNIELAIASAEHNVRPVIHWAERVKSNKRGELWTTFNAINAIRPYATKKDLEKIVKLKNQFLDAAPENSKEYVMQYIESIETSIYNLKSKVNR